MQDTPTAEHFLNRLRESLDRVDAALILDMAEFYALPAATDLALEKEKYAGVHPALVSLVEGLLSIIKKYKRTEDLAPQTLFVSYEQDKQKKIYDLLYDRLIYRFKVVSQIGVIKASKGLAVRNEARWHEVLNQRSILWQKHSLPEKGRLDFLNSLHESSCVWQELLQKLVQEGKDFL